jgi:ssDNA-binding replication factor A large subunit
MKELVDQVLARLRDQKIEVPEAEVEGRLRMLIENYRVPEGEARRSVLNYFLKEHGVTPVARAAPEKVTVSEISEPGRWVDLEVKVLDLWEPANDTISQTGLVGDSSGTMKFVKWAKSGLPELEVGKSYLLKNVVTDEFQGRFSIKLNRTSHIEALEKEIEAAALAPQAPPEDLSVVDIKEPGRWMNLRVKVLQLWEPTSETISQTGLIGDATGRIKFVKWARDDLPQLAEGKSYLLKNLVSDEFQGRFGVRFNRTSQIEELSEDIPAAAGGSQSASIAEINEPGRWIDLRGKVVQLYEPRSEAISQAGLIGDETGVIRFVKWAKADLPDLVEGRSYLFKNAVTDEFQGRFSIKMNRTSQIEELKEDIAVEPQSVELSGAIVEVQKGSGLIKRCPMCKRVLTKGICGVHGKVDGTYDLRIKAVLDDGRRAQDILVNRETTERLVGLTLDQAKQMAMEALDHEVVRGLIEEHIVGKYYTITGRRVDRYILVESINEMPPVSSKEVDDLIGLVEVG